MEASIQEKGTTLKLLDKHLDLFDNKKSRKDLAKLIDNYDPKIQGNLILITKSNATWFVTVKLK
jgi:hypothetical protein